jgi:hypothetical protein
MKLRACSLFSGAEPPRADIPIFFPNGDVLTVGQEHPGETKLQNDVPRQW